MRDEKSSLIHNNNKSHLHESHQYKHHRNQIITVAGITSTLFGTGCIVGYSSVTMPELSAEPTIKASHSDLSWIASLCVVGSVVGTLSGGVMADLLGRRRTIMLSSLLFAGGWLLIGQATGVYEILAGRLLTGIASGIYSSTVQTYVCEIVDASIRGVSGSLPTLMVCVGVIYIYVMGSIINWRTLAFISSIFPFFVFVYTYFLPESPAWLISKGRLDEAVDSLAWLRDDRVEAAEEVGRLQSLRRSSITTNTETDPLIKKGPMDTTLRARLARFREPAVLRPLGIGVTLFLIQKFCGVSAVTFYATLIFKYADNYFNNYVETIIVGFVRLFATLTGIFLVKFFKRKPLLIASGLIMFFSNGILGAYFFVKVKYGESMVNGTMGGEAEGGLLHQAVKSHGLDCIPLICITLFVLGSSIGFGTIPWFLIAEMMPSDVRSIACSLAFAFCQTCQFTAVKTFLDMVDTLDTYGTFWFYSGVAFLGAVFVTFVVPETSHLRADQIEKLFETKVEMSDEDDDDEEESSERMRMKGHHILEKSQEFNSSWDENDGSAGARGGGRPVSGSPPKKYSSIQKGDEDATNTHNV